MSPQEEFDIKYVSSAEICERLNLTRGGLTLAKKKGSLPSPILIKGGLIHIWVRQDIEPLIEQWKIKLDAKRGIANGGSSVLG